MPGNDLISIDPDILVNIRFIRGELLQLIPYVG